MSIELIDTHTHLEAPDFDADRDGVIERARAAGVTRLITIGSGYGVDSAAKAVKIAEQYDFVFAAIGLHPNDAALPLDMSFLEALASHPKVVAIGETGLDYYRDHASPKSQEVWFKAQIALAIKVHKPLIIHSRQAGAACLKILVEENANLVGGVFHCFSENSEFYSELCKLNFLVSVPGNITYKTANALRETIREIPLERIMLETDAPFLAPHPYRGKRCESSFIVETAKMVAGIKNIPLEEVARQTSLNAKTLFGLN